LASEMSHPHHQCGADRSGDQAAHEGQEEGPIKILLPHAGWLDGLLGVAGMIITRFTSDEMDHSRKFPA